MKINNINKITISLICISAIFFFYLGETFIIYILFNNNLALSYIAAVFLSVISLFGSIIFLSEMKNKSNRWYLGIPLCIAILITITILLADAINLLDFDRNNFLIDTSVRILAPCSILFFLSVPADQRKMMKIPVLISSIISIYVIFSYYHLLSGMLSPHQTSWNVIGLMSAIYWFFGMPVIGICFIVISILYKNDITQK